MSIEAKKIQIIEAVLQMQDEDSLTTLLDTIHFPTINNENKRPDNLFSVFGILSGEEAEEMKNIIEEHFEKIDPDDWR